MAFAGPDDEMSASKCRGRSRIQGFQGVPTATAGLRLSPFFVLLTADWEDRGVARSADSPGGPGIQVRLLGPFEVVLEDVAQRLPGRGERALLALLALSAGRVVAATSLVGQLWSASRQRQRRRWIHSKAISTRTAGGGAPGGGDRHV